MKTYTPEHTCGISLKNKRVKSTTLAETYADTLKAAPGMKLHALKELIRKDMGVAVSTSQCRRAKLRVSKELMGSEVKEYGMLWDYAQELRTKSPGSTIFLNVQREFDANRVMFDRFYVCFNACKRGFLDGCRRIIGVDGCFLKGICKGEILSAIGRDANNQMLPIAWAVVRIENKDTWNWFMERLMEDLRINRDDGGEGWTILSDKQKVCQFLHEFSLVKQYIGNQFVTWILSFAVLYVYILSYLELSFILMCKCSVHCCCVK